jgi:TM2 domain-containing membrane protein YozV
LEPEYETNTTPITRSESMNPLVAGIASLIIPGLGQALSGEVVRGGVIFLLLILIVTPLVLTGIGIIFAFFVEPIIHLIAAYDAYNIAGS